MPALALGLAVWVAGFATPVEGRIVVQSMRVEGVILAPPKPLVGRKDDVPTGVVGPPLGGGELTVEVRREKARVLVVMSFGGDDKLKATAEKLVGRRVVVECRGEYKLLVYKQRVQQRQIWVEEDAVFPSLQLTVVKIEPAD
ncbi:MAG: hypothetical protein K2X82_03655 [Gemmataceae bacterium]|nr:hypothetical protein [Gemmataceae bacterium]